MSAAEKRTTAQPVMPARRKLAQSMRNIYHVTVDEFTKREDLARTDYWKHIAQDLSPYTRMEVVTDDGRFFCELLVLDAGQNWASVQELRFIELGEINREKEASLMEEFEVKWRGPQLEYCVMRKKDNESIRQGMKKEEAHRFLKEYIKTISRGGND